MHGSMLVDTVWNYGFVNGLFMLMKHFRDDYDNDGYNVSAKCKDRVWRRINTWTYYRNGRGRGILYCMDCGAKFTLIRILDDWTNNSMQKQIECLNENEFWGKTKQYANFWNEYLIGVLTIIYIEVFSIKKLLNNYFVIYHLQ
eukprot:127827_1